MRASSAAASVTREEKSTLPLVMTLATSLSLACSNSAHSSLIFTVRLPTLMARRSAT